MKEETPKTAITKVEPNKLLLRGYRIDELIGNISFSQGVFLLMPCWFPPSIMGSRHPLVSLHEPSHPLGLR
jgi:hypothetical protein